jgi:hypothetical protein
MYKVFLPFLAIVVALSWSADASAGGADEPGAWSKPVNGLQARLCFTRKEKLNGTPIIITYLELRHASNDADVIELPLDGKEVAFDFTVTASDGKSVPPAAGRFQELTQEVGLIRLPYDSLLRVNIAHHGASVPKDHAAHLDLGADAAVDGRAPAPAVWDFKRGDKQTYYLEAKLTVKKRDDKRRWSGSISIPKVKLPTSGESGRPTPIQPMENNSLPKSAELTTMPSAACVGGLYKGNHKGK